MPQTPATPAVIVTSTPDAGLGKSVDFTVVTQESGVVADRRAISIGDPAAGGQRASEATATERAKAARFLKANYDDLYAVVVALVVAEVI